MKILGNFEDEKALKKFESILELKNYIFEKKFNPSICKNKVQTFDKNEGKFLKLNS
jgi:hypothetical protein